MKTITLNPRIKQAEQKRTHNSIGSRILGSNYKSINIEEINRISDIVGNKKFGDTNNIFYLKLNKDANNHNLQEIMKVNGNKSKGSATLSGVEKNEGQKSIIGIFPYIVQQNKTNRKDKDTIEQQMGRRQKLVGRSAKQVDAMRKNEDQGVIKFKEVECYPDVSMRTMYFYKKQSLNTQLQFFKAYNRHEKSKTYDREQKFNTQLIGVQKTFNYKKVKLSKTRRSVSLHLKQKQKQKKTETEMQLEIKQSNLKSQQQNQKKEYKKDLILNLHETKLNRTDKKLVPLKPKPQKSKRYRKEDGFEPWNIVEEHQPENQ